MSLQLLKVNLSAIIIVTLMISCKKESTQPAVESCSSCAYYPACTGFKYSFDEVQSDTLPARSGPYWEEEYVSAETDTIINNTNYKKVVKGNAYENTAATYSVLFYNCSNNISTTIFYQLETVAGIDTLYMVTSTLKADADLLSTWSDITITPSGKKDEWIYTMREKNISHSVIGTMYKNVIHISAVYKIDNIVDWTGDYYYAKDVGLIEHSFVNAGIGPPQAYFRLINFVH